MINNKSDLIEYLNEDKRIMNTDRKTVFTSGVLEIFDSIA